MIALKLLEAQIVPLVVDKLLVPYTVPNPAMPRWRLVFRWNMPEIGLVGEPLEWNLMPAMTLKVTFKDSKVAKVA